MLNEKNYAEIYMGGAKSVSSFKLRGCPFCFHLENNYKQKKKAATVWLVT
jgi:hypothetical protein